LVARYFVKHNTLSAAVSGDPSATQSAVSMGSQNSKRLKFKGKKGSTKASSKGSHHSSSLQDGSVMMAGRLVLGDDDASSLSESLNGSSSRGGSSSLSSNTKFLNLLGKLKTIKNSSKEDPSTAHFGTVLNFILGGYLVFFIISLIVTNTIQEATPYYELQMLLLDMNVVFNEVIIAARLLQATANWSIVESYCKWSQPDPTKVAYFPGGDNSSKPLCPWVNASYMSRPPYLNLPEEALYTNWTTQYPLRLMLDKYHKEMKDIPLRLREGYSKIRKNGDVFDQLIQGTFTMTSFVNGSASIPTDFTLRTFWNVLGTVADAVNVLNANVDLEPHSARAWGLIVANRYHLGEYIESMTDIIPDQARTAINNNMIFHFIIAIISVFLGAVSLCDLISLDCLCVFDNSSYPTNSSRSGAHSSIIVTHAKICRLRSCA